MRLTPEKLIKLARVNSRLDIEERALLLGYTTKGHIMLSELSSYLIGGMTGQGKTIILTHLCWAAVVAGAQLLIVDPHLNNKKRGLLTKINPLAPWFIRDPVSFEDLDEVVACFEWLEQEYKRRKSRDGMLGARPLFLFVDEFNEMLSELDKAQLATVTRVIGNVARGGNKHGLCVVLCAHNWELSGSGGSKVRKNIPGRLAVNCESSEMAMILNLHDRKRMDELCYPSLKKGDAIVKHPSEGLMRLSYPFTNEEDCAAIAEMMSKIQDVRVGTMRMNVATSVQVHGKHEYDEREGKNEKKLNAPAEPRERDIHAPIFIHACMHRESGEGNEYCGKNENSPTKEMRIVDEAVKQLIVTGKKIKRTKLRDELNLNNHDWPLIQQICDEVEAAAQQEQLTDSLWEALKKHYDYTCLACGHREPEIELTRDRVLPGVKGGDYRITNVQPLCSACNASKRERMIDYR